MRPHRLPGLLAAATLAACGGGIQDLEDYVAKVRERPAAPIEPLPEIRPIATFLYDPGDRRDPFLMDTPSEDSTAPNQPGGIAPDPLRRKEELEQYTLDALKMVGTLAQEGTNWALILTPEGVLHRVRVGNYLGQNNGQIIRIDEGQVQLTEIVNDGAGEGEWRERQAAVALKQ
jgi:type IV pilus assembly protein PilP